MEVELLKEELFNNLSDYSKEDLKEINKAYELAKDLHINQVRQSGEPYIIHPISVAIILSELKAGADLAELMVRINMAKSRSEVRKLLEQGGIYLNDNRVENSPKVVTDSDIIDDEMILRKGKKNYMKVRVIK